MTDSKKTNLNDVIGALLEAAVRDQHAINDAIKEMKGSRRKMDDASDTLPSTVASRVSASLKVAIDDAANTLLERFNHATTEADRAAAAYQKASREAPRRFVLLGIGVTFVAITALATLAWCFTPSMDEIRARRAERDNLENQVEWLKQAAHSDLTTCRLKNNTVRLCAKLDRQFSDQWGGYRIITEK
ncbi:hypothetical protein [Duganella radicis]|uniref:Uncharacterized protein n=1 Tax=Duganella radicis TaxID=551988 RepID=A0A6L6PUW2_9BURK|nr:hypothetical protein [Duganella radicis]MTV42035.1 hypothetical protein [Duganella radicis]